MEIKEHENYIDFAKIKENKELCLDYLKFMELFNIFLNSTNELEKNGGKLPRGSYYRFHIEDLLNFYRKKEGFSEYLVYTKHRLVSAWTQKNYSKYLYHLLMFGIEYYVGLFKQKGIISEKYSEYINKFLNGPENPVILLDEILYTINIYLNVPDQIEIKVKNLVNKILLYNPQESVPVLEELYFDKIKTLVDIVKLKDFYKKPKLISTNISKISFQINKEVLQNLKEKRA